jgi:hypothetical protein
VLPDKAQVEEKFYSLPIPIAVNRESEKSARESGDLELMIDNTTEIAPLPINR